jgi:hypothetical protein
MFDEQELAMADERFDAERDAELQERAVTRFIIRLANGTYIAGQRPVVTRAAAKRFHSEAAARERMAGLMRLFPNNPALKTFSVIKVKK